MKALSGLALIALSLTVAACGKKEEGGATSAQPVAAVAAPAGTTWSETIAATPEGYFLMGNPDAKVKLVEYGSYTCSHCRDFAAESAEEIRQIVDSGKMSFEFRNYVRDPIDISTALLARCGGKDIFYPLSDQFFANQNAMFEKAQALGDERYKALMSAPPAQRFGQLAEAIGLVDFAKQRGIAEDQAKQCLADTAAAEKLAKTVEDANRQYKIEGTPTFILNGVMVENTAAWPALRAKLKEAGI
ncbi:thiol-disulfide oxidoreductase [Sphingobium sp. TA15]|uniref:Protein-disulfide isomerase n=3 Tax=Sphingobium indicum TaxID=332055 RepID=D4YX42_SPHIU|nr:MULTISPECIES: thioredoxin domain-containing protein [Sphingobium]EPR13587.1 protein-disulfide isomerase [Sphingobium indicum IP26]KEY99058.1 protein-disulfide isomerase [Sphingomonas sp. BHC-A]BDD67810.1 thiol-disulfide oxidoreductase [Sphingobium sp. TA15]APL95773.1 protein-disulfide isomerase [Sphingobium indicum B90A]EQB02223.1 protein-disulfide isomerase [Sphingobium sp. HDIP04]